MVGLEEIVIIMSVIAKIKSEIVENIKGNSGLLFPQQSTLGYLVAVAIPLEDDKFPTYFSFGFEEYYLLPYKNYVWFPTESERSSDQHSEDGSTRMWSEANVRSIYESLVTRKILYKAVEKKLDFFGIDGKPCLLRTICEVSSEDFSEHNGVWGDLLHVIFMPTTSADEGLSDEYYQAEFDGSGHDCSSYFEDCPISLLDFFTKEFDW